MHAPARAALVLLSLGGLWPLAGPRGAAAQGERPSARMTLLDRHGHPLAHDPPLWRDAACAPALWTALRGAGPERTATPQSALDGGLQALALRTVQRGVERLARSAAADWTEVASAPPGAEAAAPAARADGKGRPPLVLGARAVGTVLAVQEVRVGAVVTEQLVLQLRGGARATLPLPPRLACEGHAVAPLPPASARFHAGERLLVRVTALGGAGKDAVVSLQPQAALVALAPDSREVLALSGGYDQHPGDFDRALQGRRQAGSTWKPLVYAEALASGRHALAEQVQDLPTLYGGWRPRNYQEGYRGPVRLRMALAHSINTIAVRLLADVGPGRVAALAQRLGIPAAQVPRDLTQALGTALVSPLQLAAAYAALADTKEGRYLPPRLWAAAAAPEAMERPPALRPQVAYLISSALHSVIEEGSAARARALLPHLHGKTGTTSNGADAWFVGYHGALLAVVWVGEDTPAPAQTGGKRTGAEAALPLWMEFMQGAAQQGYAPVALPRPAGIKEVALPEGGTELALIGE